jgi:lipid-A-disaccharide synthase-like uncharacterized protein
MFRLSSFFVNLAKRTRILPNIMRQIILASIGWLGVVLCTVGYLLLSIKVIKADSLSFQLLNILGGLFLVATAVDSNDMPNAVSNVLWMFIGVYALGRQLRTQSAVKTN